MEINLGHKGAFGDSWRLKSVRNLFATLVDDNPDASEDTLVRLCMERIRSDDEYAEAAAMYIVRNAIESQERQRRTRAAHAPQARAQRQEETREKVEALQEQIMLLNLEQPNGKRLRYCTREDIAKWGKGYERMAKKMKPRQMVGQAFQEEQVRAYLK